MKRRRFCWLGMMIPLGIVLTPALLWILVVLVAPTNWARRHVVAALERASGRSVELDDLDVCLDGGIDLTGLKICAPGGTGDPWLVAQHTRLDVSMLQLLRGKFDPTYLEVDDATLRVRRRDDGSIELADMVPLESRRAGVGNRDSDPCGPTRLRAKLSRIRIVVLDQPTETNVTFEDVEGEGDWGKEGGLSATLSGRWNQGTFQLTGHLDHAGGERGFEGELRASDVALDGNMSLLRYAVPILAGAQGQAQGRLAMDVYLRGQGDTKEKLQQSLVGHGKVALDPINLDGTPLMVELGKVMERPIPEKVGSIVSDFVVQSARITTDRLTVTAGRLPIVLSGWTDFQGRLDYTVKLDGISERVSDQARRLLQGLDLDLKLLTSIRLSGDVSRVAIGLNGPDNAKAPVEQLITPGDRERFRVLGRQLRDRVLR